MQLDGRSDTIIREPAEVLPVADAVRGGCSSSGSTLHYRSRNAILNCEFEYFAHGMFETVEVTWETVRQSGWGSVRKALQHMEDDDAAWAGYIAYEMGFAFEKAWHNLDIPKEGYALRMYRIPCWYEINRGNQTAAICKTKICTDGDVSTLNTMLGLCHLGVDTEGRMKPAAKSENVQKLGELQAVDYMNKVEEVQRDINAGRFYELNLTQRFRTKSQLEPGTVYWKLLRDLNPSQSFFAGFSDESICGASPEVFLQKVGDQIVTRPIKGSYVNRDEDFAKLHAEHVMVVDMARNDLGRICKPGTVDVTRLAAEEQFGLAHHLVSTIQGSTDEAFSEILKATYPAASITGAPKVEVVTAINALEASRRGVYTGACGWLFPNGDIDLNVAIRTLRAVPSDTGWHYEAGAGGAIVADSDGEMEYNECLMKVLPLLSSLEHSE